MTAWSEIEKTIQRLADGDLKAKEVLDNLHFAHNEDVFSSTVYRLMRMGLKGSRIVDLFDRADKDYVSFIRLVRDRSASYS